MPWRLNNRKGWKNDDDNNELNCVICVHVKCIEEKLGSNNINRSSHKNYNYYYNILIIAYKHKHCRTELILLLILAFITLLNTHTLTGLDSGDTQKGSSRSSNRCVEEESPRFIFRMCTWM